MMRTTPNDLDVLLHCYISPEKHPRSYAPAVEEAIRNFIVDSILLPTDQEGIFTVTEKGKVWLEMILDVPYPVQRWGKPE